MREASRIREDEADREAQTGHETMMQSEIVGVIVPNYTDPVYFSKKSVPIDFSVDCIEYESQEDQGQA